MKVVIPKVDYEGSSQSTVELMTMPEGFAGASASMRLLACFCFRSSGVREPGIMQCNAICNVGPCCQWFLFLKKLVNKRVSSQATGFFALNGALVHPEWESCSALTSPSKRILFNIYTPLNAYFQDTATR